MSFVYTKPTNRLGDIETPLHLSHFLYRTLKHLRPKVILDPCVGRGNLLVPWLTGSNRKLVGIDIKNTRGIGGMLFSQGDFLNYEQRQDFWPLSLRELKPNLVLCNPPWNRPSGKRGNDGATDAQGNPLCRNMPERFLRRIIDLYGKDIPIAFICPMGFRLNQRTKSKRWRWLSSSDAPTITSTIALPIDVFPKTQFHSEVILFNCRGVKPHYFLDYLVSGEARKNTVRRRDEHQKDQH